MKRNRSAKTGKFVDEAEAAANPDTTVSETVKKPLNGMAAFDQTENALELDALFSDILNRLAFDNDFVGRKGDELLVRVKEMRARLRGETSESSGE